jgi:type VI secretion system protein ImpA
MIESSTLASLREQLPALLAPIPGADPAGHDLQQEPEFAVLHEARREDDSSLPMGVWESELKRADWGKVEMLASDLLGHRGKDLTVAAWLGEAWLQRYRFDGLYAALELLCELGERYGAALYPRPQNEEASWLGPPLAWMARKYVEVLCSRTPLLDAHIRDVETPTQMQWQDTLRKARNKSEDRRSLAEAAEGQANLRLWQDMVLSVPLAEIQQQVQVLHGCIEKLAQLNRWSDAHLLDEAPSFSALQAAIERVIQTLQELIAMHPQPVVAPVLLDVVVETVAVEAPAAPVAAVAMGFPDSRDAAYQQLKVISDYLASVEPHSPVPYLIERAIEWGHMPLRELLGELVNADVDTRRIWSVLGVLP